MTKRDGACAVVRCRGDGEYEVRSLGQSIALVCLRHATSLGDIIGHRVVVDPEMADGWRFRVEDDRPDRPPTLYPPGTRPPEF